MTSKVIKNQDVNYVKLSIPDTVPLITQTFEKIEVNQGKIVKIILR